MSLIKVNNIESLNGPTGTINMTGNLVVNGMPISGSTGPTGTVGPTGPASVGGIGGATVVYVSADSDPITNGLALQAAYNTAGLLPQSTTVLSTVELYFDGMSVYMYSSIPWGSVLQVMLAQTSNILGGGSPLEITVNGTPAWYSWDGMSIKMSRTIDMMTPVEMGTWDVMFDDVVYTQNTLIIGPGYYETPDTFIIDKDTVNITSVSGNPDVFIYNLTPGISGTTAPNSSVHVAANAIKVTGISTDFTVKADVPYPGMYSTFNISAPFTIGGGLISTLENCVGGANSFGHRSGDGTSYISSTFINCVGGQYSFGRDGDSIAGTYKNCVGGDYSFGYGGCTVNGNFENCSGGYYAFGGFGGTTVGGIFYNCRVTNTGGFSPNNGTLSGTFINCIVQDQGFGQNGANITGVFYNCVGGYYCWQGQQAGKVYNCVAGVGSWNNIAAGKLYHCVISYDNSTTFATVTSGGRTYYCIDGYGNTNNQ